MSCFDIVNFVSDSSNGGMGNLLKVLTRQSEPGSADIFIDFENANPTESEKEVFEVVREVLKVAPDVLSQLDEYSGASEKIREVCNIWFSLLISK